MAMPPTNCSSRTNSLSLHLSAAFHLSGGHRDACGYQSHKFSARLGCGYRGRTVKAFASQDQTKKSRRQGKKQKDKNFQPDKLPEEYDISKAGSFSGDNYVEDDSKMSSPDNFEAQTSVMVASRSAVLQACTVTSCSIGALGVLIREVSHVASTEGLPIIDCSTSITLNFESWHLELIMGLVVLVSSCRYLLLKTWPDFAESSEAANRQVLTSLEPLDYIIVALLSGFSEELLFRGALLPLLGVSWMSIAGVAALFGVLHLGSGRNYSFAVWATLVGLAYGYASVLSSSLLVPMTSHALNNLVGGIIWRYTSNSAK